MDSILGPIPEAPTISWVPDFVQQCAIKDVEEDLFGDQELMPYDPKQHFNYSIKEISEEMGLDINTIRSLLQRSKEKVLRRLLIVCMMDIAPESEIFEIIREKNCIHYLKNVL